MKPTQSRRSTRISAVERKASIIAAATTLFAAKGFNGTRTRDIAREAGVSEALLFKHFPTKGDLYGAILGEQSPVPHLMSEMKALVQARADEQIFSHIAHTIIQKAPHPHLMRLLLFSALEGHDLSDLFFQNHVRGFHEFLADYIAQRIQDGAFRPVNPLLAARAFMGMLINHRLLTHIFRLPVPAEPAEIERTIVGIFLDGLQPQGLSKTAKTRVVRSGSKTIRTKASK